MTQNQGLLDLKKADFLSLARFQVHQLLCAVLNSCKAWRQEWSRTTEQIFESGGRREGGAILRRLKESKQASSPCTAIVMHGHFERREMERNMEGL